jgi:hypothetical protein
MKRSPQRVSSNVATTLAATRAPRVARVADLRKRWWGGWGSNPRPKDYESSALTD